MGSWVVGCAETVNVFLRLVGVQNVSADTMDEFEAELSQVLGIEDYRLTADIREGSVSCRCAVRGNSACCVLTP
jgi:hypothetical protein